jgi:CheY-like chemotaxis protein
MTRGAALGNDPGTGQAPQSPAASAAPVPPTDGAPVVLLAEDEDSLRGMLDIVLRGSGYRVLLCANGSQAKAELEGDGRIDAALFDLRMPEVSGSELLALLRGDPRRARTPAIAMSAYNDDQQAQALLLAGADAFLAKPFSLQQLTSTLASLLESTPGR